MLCSSVNNFFNNLFGSSNREPVQVIPRHYGTPPDDTGGDPIQNINIPIVEKDERTKDLIRKAIYTNEFLKTITDENRLKLIVDTMYSQDFKADNYIIKEGEDGNHLYVSASGTFEVLKNGVILKIFCAGEVFGELAILYNHKRFASVRATSEAKVWVLNRKLFQNIMLVSSVKEVEENVHLLSAIPRLQSFNTNDLVMLSDLCEIEFFPSGTVIIRQGDIGDKFYVIRAGKVTISRRVQDDSGTDVDVSLGILSHGHYFGELALINEIQRQATIIAQAPGVECLTLDFRTFKQYFGNSEDIKGKKYKEKLDIVPTLITKVENEYSHLRLKDLQVTGTLGVGGFGEVQLVQYRKDRSKSFALKRIPKANVKSIKHQEHIYNEKNILFSCQNDFICRLYQTYKDDKYIYFLSEVCLGGDVWTLMSQKKYLDEKSAQFIIACVIEALDYLHSKGIIYRNLKSEDIVLDFRGYAKLTDFGFAKRMVKDKTYTFCAVANIPPEIILGKGHDRAVDYWALGILIHELLTGQSIFRCDNLLETYQIILKGIDKLKLSSQIPKNAQNLIKALCKANYISRLGYQNGGFSVIRQHKWLINFRWESLKTGNLEAPIIKPIKGPTDLSNFPSGFPIKEDPPNDFSGWDTDF